MEGFSGCLRETGAVQRASRLLGIALVAAFLAGAPGAAWSGGGPVERVRAALDVLSQVQDIPEQGIPEGLLSSCQGIAVFPSVYKAGFFIGARYGRGVLLARDPYSGRWHGPAFLVLGGASLGWQLGVQATDLVLVIMNRRGVDAFLQNNLTLGGELSVAAGPVGRKANMSTDITLKAEVYSYSRSKGFFAGISLGGAYIGQDYGADRQFYGKTYTPAEILRGKVPNPPELARKLTGMLDKVGASRDAAGQKRRVSHGEL